MVHVWWYFDGSLNSVGPGQIWIFVGESFNWLPAFMCRWLAAMILLCGYTLIWVILSLVPIFPMLSKTVDPFNPQGSFLPADWPILVSPLGVSEMGVFGCAHPRLVSFAQWFLAGAPSDSGTWIISGSPEAVDFHHVQFCFGSALLGWFHVVRANSIMSDNCHLLCVELQEGYCIKTVILSGFCCVFGTI